MAEQGDILEIKVRDMTGRLLDKFKLQADDDKLLNKVIAILKKKYNIKLPTAIIEEDIMDKDWLDVNDEIL